MSAASSQPEFVVTGPSGWIGQAMLAHLADVYGGTLSGRVTAFASHARQMQLNSGETLSVRSLEDIRPADIDGAHVIHLAYLTREKAELLGERAFTNTNLAIDDLLLNAMRDADPMSLFVASSGAASLAASGRDIHPYGLCKLRQEARFLEAGERAGMPVLAGRIFNLSGPFINKTSSYAISDMAMQAHDKGVISISASVPVFRSFLHVNDLCAMVRLAGINRVKLAEPVDLCGGEVIEMLDLATVISKVMGLEGQIERMAVDYTNPSVYLGDFPQTRVLAMALGVTLTPLQRQIEDTVNWLFAQPKMPSLAK